MMTSIVSQRWLGLLRVTPATPKTRLRHRLRSALSIDPPPVLTGHKGGQQNAVRAGQTRFKQVFPGLFRATIGEKAAKFVVFSQLFVEFTPSSQGFVRSTRWRW